MVVARIKLAAIEFGDVPFRKLLNMKIPIAERLTLIAGHNGLGKSTILGLAANGSGITQAAYRSYFDRTYQGNLYEIIFIDFEGEYENRRTSGQPLPNPILTYSIDGRPLTKKCTLTPRKQRGEIRVVPRNDPHVAFDFDGGNVGTDGKVPLPTLFLGMSRMLPIGESDPEWASSSSEASFHPDDAMVIRNFIDGVIPGPLRGGPGTPTITTQSIRGTKKTAKHPDYPYSSKAISLGQDSLSAIATAVASFAKLKREWKGYCGGLLVIDELDAGLHPHAQTKLAQALKRPPATTTCRSLQQRIRCT
jgi:energy-coupling factor transporter ATP-binding protein EcfA2